jgi:hypothetical protein
MWHCVVRWVASQSSRGHSAFVPGIKPSSSLRLLDWEPEPDCGPLKPREVLSQRHSLTSQKTSIPIRAAAKTLNFVMVGVTYLCVCYVVSCHIFSYDWFCFLLRNIIFAWVVTVPIATGLSALTMVILKAVALWSCLPVLLRDWSKGNERRHYITLSFFNWGRK